jgi:Cdc6-like AAA superfamily ATPase
VVYGQRGVGKSSLARQLVKLATNDKSIVTRLKAPPHEELDFLPVYLACDDSIKNVDGLLLRLLSDPEGLAPWIPFKVMQKQATGDISAQLSVKVITLGGKKSESISERAVEVEEDVTTTFVNACRALLKAGPAKHGLLLVIDEFDRVKDKRGMASLMKTLGPEGVRFALVGVATTVQDLVMDHESVARQLSDGTVPVPPMSVAEMNEIIDRAEKLLGGGIQFRDDARKWMINISRGHPYYIHLVGKHALLRALQAKETVVTETTVKDALTDIALKGTAPIQEAAYKKAIGHSYVRELILKRFADRTENEIYTTDLYAGLAKELGIEPTAVSVYVGHLASEKHGQVLSKTRERYYQFGDSLFKAYAAARPFERRIGDQESE